MILSAQQLITKSFRDIGLVKMNEPIDPGNLADALIDMNMLVDAFGLQAGMSRNDVEESFVLKGGKRQYTIGQGGDFNTGMPWQITSAYIVDPMNNVYEVGITDSTYLEQREDALITTTRPTEISFDPGPTQQAVPIGVITCYPIPDSLMLYTLHLNQIKPFTEFTSLMDTVTFPSSYYLCLRYNLAVILWPQYKGEDGKPLSRNIIGLAAKWKAEVVSANVKPSIAMIELGRKVKGYNILEGPYN
jgi:hypothetical protein